MTRRSSLRLAFMAFAVTSSVVPDTIADVVAKKACAATAEDAQQLRTEKRLGRARKQFIACAQESCPQAVRDDCVQWLAEVERAMPSVVIAVRDEAGSDVAVKRVLVDSELLVEKIDGKAVEVDPGMHRFRAEAEDGTSVELEVVVAEGEKSRAVTLVRRSTRAPPPERAGIPASAWVLGSVSVVAFGSFAYFGLTARADASERRSSCGPTCPENDLDAIRRKLLIADVSLGVGVVSLGIATFITLTRPSKPNVSTAIDLQPIAGGAVASLRTTF